MIYIIIFLASFFLTYLIKEYSIKKSLVDIPNDRSSHSVATPHGGGIAIAITWFMGISYLFYTNDMEAKLYYTLLLGIIISVVSYIDDLFLISAKIRLITQAILASSALYLLGGFNELNLFFMTLTNPFLTNIFAFFLIIWFINLYNFLDGIDGYAGSEALFLSLSGLFFFGGSHFLVLAAATLGFLLWNWHKAKIFMGDVGSTLLGYNVAIFTLYYSQSNSENFWIWIILFTLFWFDATLTLLRRFKNSEKLSQAHKKHAYQRLTQVGWSHSKVVIYSILINILLVFLLYISINIAITFVLTTFLVYLVVKYIDKKRGFS